MKKIKKENILANRFPELISEWHPTKNEYLTPNNISYGSRKKIWWQCKEGHEWQVSPNLRTSLNTGCPLCPKKNRKKYEDNRLLMVYPHLAKEWHPTKNENLTPNDISFGSGKKVWWKCKENHEWEDTPNRRTALKLGCPKCKKKNRRNYEEKKLCTVRPDLAKEWHPTKNEGITPNDITYGSGKKVWWKCEKEHEWMASVVSRVNYNGGCPKCRKGISTSFPEQAIFYFIKKVFSDAVNRYIYKSGVYSYELDIYIPCLNVGIEYDGMYFHDNKKRDLEKNKFFQDKLKLIRIRDRRTPKMNSKKNSLAVFYRDNEKFESIEDSISYIFDYLIKNCNLDEDIEKRIKNLEIDLMKNMNNINQQTRDTNIKGSLAEKRPDLLKEWHPTKNFGIDPFNVGFRSAKVVWWLCEKGHEWQEEVFKKEKRKNSCPCCYGIKVSLNESLEYLRPDLAKEWHPTRNKNSSPKDISVNSIKRVWWLCDNGHSWTSSVKARANKADCPKCK